MNIKKTLFHGKTNRKRLLLYLKQENSYSHFKRLIPQLMSHSQMRSYLNRGSLPKEYSEVRKSKILPYVNNLGSEIAWSEAAILRNKEKINLYLHLREDFQRAILLCDYTSAYSILSEIDETICYSNWSIEQRLLLSEYAKGTDENWIQLNRITTELTDGLSIFLAENSSKKAESNFSYSGYRNTFESTINELHEQFKEYLCFKLLYTGYIGFKSFAYYLNVESSSSIIDRYNLHVDILTELFYSGEEAVKLSISAIAENVEDYRLKKLQSHYENSLEEEVASFIDERLDKCYDAYTQGHYDSCCQLCVKFLRSQPDVFEVYVLYIKALIEDGRTFVSPKISVTVDTILETYFNLFSLNDQYYAAIEDALKLSLQYISSNFGRQLLSVASDATVISSSKGPHKLAYFVNSKYFNPKSINVLYNINDLAPRGLVETLSKANSPTYTLNHSIANGMVDKIQADDGISAGRKCVYLAQAKYRIGDYQSSFKLAKIHLENEGNSIITTRDLTELLIMSSIADNNAFQAQFDYVKYYIENSKIVYRINATDLANLKGLEQDESNTIIQPILYSIASYNNYDVYTKYDDYLMAQGVNRPSELFALIDTVSQLLIYFLRKVCTIDVMQNSINFSGTDDIEIERINILKFLLEVDETNSDGYVKEISEITRKNKVRKTIQEVNKGRITVNVEQLKSEEKVTFKDKFNRLASLLAFSEKYDIQSMDHIVSMLVNYVAKMEDEVIAIDLGNRKNPSFLYFRFIFMQLRDKYLFSKDYGLDGYLSTRIRHGTLENHIRSVFESSNIICQKRGDDYIDNTYWLTQTPYINDSNKSKFLESFVRFSEAVDHLSRKLVDDYVQIKTDMDSIKKEGWFDFTYTNYLIETIYNQIKYIKDPFVLLASIFEVLENHLERILFRIRQDINTKLKEKYLGYIDDLSKEINEIFSGKPPALLNTAIARSQTNIINEINNISEWFNLSNPEGDMSLDLRTVIETSVEIVNNIYPRERMEVDIVDHTEVPFKFGSTSMIYIFNILLENVIKHSGLSAEDRIVSVTTEFIEGKYLKITVANNLDLSLIEKVDNNLDNIRSEWLENKSNFEKINIEGGSGFNKIRKMLAVDLKMSEYLLDYTIEDGILNIILLMKVRLTVSNNMS
ncbi:hypothetical protein [Lewinella sp. IMCC34183]|uniref:hypothetical protein n=1 Tax=Lewinella sp. IMCC34183 TaxID=2248762 RepID=UPI00130088D1|nr:hypothetical protein [Lewinella sp. IMCC34183]